MRNVLYIKLCRTDPTMIISSTSLKFGLTKVSFFSID